MARKPLNFIFLGVKATEEEIARDGHLLVKTDYGYMYPPDNLPQRTYEQVEKGIISSGLFRQKDNIRWVLQEV